MPIMIRKSKDGHGVVITGHGTVTDREYLQTFLEHLNESPDERRGQLYTLVDWSGITRAEVKSDSIRHIADMCKLKAPPGLKLILATVAIEDVVYGLARMADVFKQRMGWQTAIFRNRNDAEGWITQKVKEQYALDSLNFETVD
ncbi:MAG: hypothetical protein JXR25_07100 [Pontiellaceae bacterium]|nr:hypothetical protein [Pontiellaceae bacterium]MBN2784578.1 hypothetical protein [Pontiellaceae bacterium]